MTQLTVGTTLVRQSEHGPIDCDVVVTYEGRIVTPEQPPSWEDPGCAAEIDAEFISAEFDGGAPDEAPGPLTAGEVATLRARFHSPDGQRLVYQDIVERANTGPDADDARDRAIDDRMFRNLSSAEGEEY